MGNNKTKRMDKPEDNLLKRQSAYAGDVIHQYLGFPGKYLGPCVNEYPNAGGGVPRTDSTYFVDLNGVKCVMNVEDESTRVDNDTLVKIDNYRVNIEYGTKLPVINAIRTTLQPDKCQKVFHKSPTLTLTPIIKSYPQMDGRQRLSNISSKINSNKILTNVEALDLIMIPKMFTESQEEVLEEVCILLKNLRIRDENFKIELILQMQCVIHKYAKTLDDIERLEGVIGLQKAMTAREYQDKLLIDQGIEQGINQGIEQGFNQGIEQGIDQGKFDMALKLKDELGIDEAVRISGFSRKELERGKLDR